jgi:hypothetical protein
MSVTLRDSHVVVGQWTVRDVAPDEYACAAGYSADADVRRPTISSALHTRAAARVSRGSAGLARRVSRGRAGR